MIVNNPHSVDRAYKFIYKTFGIIFHYFLYQEYGEIEFIDTEIADTGQRKDIAVLINGIIRLTEFMSTPVTPSKMFDLFDYHMSECDDNKDKNVDVKSAVVSTAKIGEETERIDVDDNVTFKLSVKFIKRYNGWKVLNTFINKSITQERISEMDAVKLILLPDMDIEMSIKELMSRIIVLLGELNFQSAELKEKTIKCIYVFLKRFFRNGEFDEMINMLKSEVKDPKVAQIIEKFGPGLDVYYLGGKQDGYVEGYDEGHSEGYDVGHSEGYDEAQLNIAKNLIKYGLSERRITRSTQLPLSKIKQLKREL